MSTVAEQLRSAREQQNLTVHQVADITKIKTDHILALEAGDYNGFAAPVYVRGCTRTYARLLKLEESSVMARLNEELASIEKFNESRTLSGEPHTALDHVMFLFSKLNRRVVVPGLLGLAVLLASFWGLRACQQRPSKDPLANLGPGLYKPPPGTSGELLPLPTNGPSAKPK